MTRDPGQINPKNSFGGHTEIAVRPSGRRQCSIRANTCLVIHGVSVAHDPMNCSLQPTNSLEQLRLRRYPLVLSVKGFNSGSMYFLRWSALSTELFYQGYLELSRPWQWLGLQLGYQLIPEER